MNTWVRQYAHRDGGDESRASTIQRNGDEVVESLDRRERELRRC